MDVHAGYDIRFSGTLVISKSRDEFFHVVAGDARVLALGPYILCKPINLL